MHEVNFDGLVGLTHNYGGLSYDNVASISNKGLKSNPKKAALQGLHKMKFLADLSLKQAVLPPHERPYIPALKSFGFSGSDADILDAAYKKAPELIQAATSASAIWVANAATVTPSIDTLDGKTYFTPANLFCKLHRAIEAPGTLSILKSIFKNEDHFTVHPPLMGYLESSDEGAANHSRLCPSHETKEALHFFVYGRGQLNETQAKRYFPRQSLLASQTVARTHQIASQNAYFAQQNPEDIDAGVFHNDVIATGNEDTYLYHEKSYVNTHAVIKSLKSFYLDLFHKPLVCLKVPSIQVTLKVAVKSYLFNSQIITLPNGQMAIIAPEDCLSFPEIQAFIQSVIHSDGNRIQHVHYFDLKQSMSNGGGPACLRLRVPLLEEAINALPTQLFINDTTCPNLLNWIEKYYREELYPEDVRDPQLLEESKSALDNLTQILNIGSVYHFQKT